MVSANNEKNVLDFLQQHPDFLSRHAGQLGIEPVGNKVVSFAQAELAALKKKTEKMARQLEEMLDAAEHNKQTAEKLNIFNKRLLAAGTLKQFAAAVSQSLETDFALPCHAFRILQQPAAKSKKLPPESDAAGNASLCRGASSLKGAVCTTRPLPALRALLPDDPLPESFLQLPVVFYGNVLAVLIIGHPQVEYFRPGTSTDLVENMAANMAVSLARLLGTVKN